jgi:TPR repeat protein
MNFTSLTDISDNFPLIFYDYELPYTEIILEMYNNPNIELEKYDLENHIILNLIAQYYHLIFINYENAKKFYLLAIANGNLDSIFSLAFYYKIVEKNYEEMIKYYLLTIQYETNDAMYALTDLANYYYYQDDHEEMTKYHLMAIEKGSVVSMKSLGQFYYQIKSYEEMIKYYKMAIEKKCSESMVLMGHYCCIIHDYEEMIKYYKMAIEHGDIEPIKYLANYYKKIKDYNQMIKYYLISIEHNNLNILNELEIYYNNDLKFYHILSNLENKSIIVIKKIDELLESPIVLKYINKLKTSNENIQECLICCDNLQHISFSCGHEICINCYCLVNKCYYRCNT